MTDPRDAARQWLAELIAKRCPGCSEQSNGWEHIRPAEAGYLAAAILDAPGITVDQVRGALDLRGVVHPASDRPSTLAVGNATQVVIRLPAIPLDGEQT